jgi:hypothetical protein
MCESIVAIKNAGQEALLMLKRKKFYVPPFIKWSIDGTGAGDAFCARGFWWIPSELGPYERVVLLMLGSYVC